MYPVFYPSPHIHIPLYLLTISLSFCISIFYLYKRSIHLNLSPVLAMEIATFSMIGSFIGARLFHVLFEYPEYYWNHPVEILKFYNGGFVFYGGLIGGLIFSLFYIKRKKQHLGTWLDIFAPIIPIGYSLGRVACIFAGCCYGRYCSLPWAISFPEGVEAPAHTPLHPTQVYYILLGLLSFLVVKFLEKNRSKISLIQFPGGLFFSWLILHGILRLIIEPFRGDFRGAPILGISLGTIISFIIIILSCGVFIKQNQRKI